MFGLKNKSRLHAMSRLIVLVAATCFIVTVSHVTAAEKVDKKKNESRFAQLDQGITSFGAAVLDGYLYLYGGHTGDAHNYYTEAQSNQFLRQNLKSPGKWEELESGPRLQGLALVAHGDKLYRIGGFSAMNKEDEDQDLVSSAEVACYDTKTKKWTSVTSMPEARSSHDAVVIGDKLYVAGGWAMKGKDGGDSHWHTSAYVADLSKPELKWVKLPDAPFQRRALALGEHDGKLFVIGGMEKEGGPCTKVAFYDPPKKTWSEGPSVNGKGIDAFGCSAFSVGDKLYMTTMNGEVQRLSEDGSQWEKVDQLNHPRFFHRLLPLSSHELIAVGGAHMGSGKILELDTVSVE